MSIAIIGVGQQHRGDDAVGLEAVRLWMKSYPHHAQNPNFLIVFVESPIVDIIEFFDKIDFAIVVDAIKGCKNPGEIYLSNDLDEMKMMVRSTSTHGIGLIETIKLMKMINPAFLSTEIVLIGIEIEQTNLGEKLSPLVEASLPKVVELIEETILKYISQFREN